MNLAIAYLDMNGKGFDPVHPWIDECVNSVEHGCRIMDDLVSDGYQRVTLFAYGDEEELPECIGWDFIMSHKV